MLAIDSVREDTDVSSKTAIMPSLSSEVPEAINLERIDYRLEVGNLPKYFGYKDFRKFLNTHDILQAHKVSVTHGSVVLTFRSNEECAAAATKITGSKFKGSVLTARTFKQSVQAKRSNHKIARSSDDIGAPSEKNAKLQGLLSPTDELLNAVTPLHKLTYSEQLQWKQEESRKLLCEITRDIQCCYLDVKTLPTPKEHLGELSQIRPSPQTVGYRNKFEFTIGYGHTGAVTVGFHITPFSAGQIVVAPDSCSLVPDEVKALVRAFQSYLEKSDKTVHDGSNNAGFWRQITVRYFSFDLLLIVVVHPQQNTDAELLVVKKELVDTFFTQRNAAFRVTSLYFQRLVQNSDVPQYEHLAGAPYVYETVLNRRFEIAPGAFFQTNTRGAEILYRIIAEQLPSDSAHAVLLDICCGTGTIGISLADRVRRVVGIELNADAVKNAVRNAQHAELKNAEFHTGMAESVFTDLLKTSTFGPDDVVVGVLDPPRAGLGNKLVAAIRAFGLVRRLIYVSCEPRMARKNFVDLCRPMSKRYCGEPFALRLVVPMDMFPQTKLFEWVMVFDR